MKTPTHDLLTALRDLDPADRPADTPEAGSPMLSERASADLESILATPRTSADRSTAPVRSRERAGAARSTRAPRPVGRLAMIGAAAGLVAFLGVFVPGAATSSYAGWSVQPATLSAAQAADLGDRCGGMHADLPGLRPVLADQRGGTTLTVLTTTEGHLATCFLGSGGAGTGYASPEPLPAMETGRVVDVATVASVGAARTSLGIPLPVEDWSSSIAGRVAPEVTGIVVHTLDGHAVQASIEDGIWAAWWPTADGEGSDALLGLDLTVTLADGSEQQVRVGSVMIDAEFWGE